MSRTRLSWKTLEYEHVQRSPDWFWAVGIIGVAAATTAAVVGNVLFAILLGLGTAALLLQALRHPREIQFAISNRGVHIGSLLYPYSSLESFWVTEDEQPKLLIKHERLLMPLIVIPLGNTDPDEVRDVLIEFLYEEEQHEPVSQRLMEFLGF